MTLRRWERGLANTSGRGHGRGQTAERTDPFPSRASGAQGESKSVRRILVVDDNKVILKTTASKLKAAGYEVLTAENGGSAIRQVRQLHPHLILLDLNFPPDVGCSIQRVSH